MSSINFWFEDEIDAYLLACARGVDWRGACAAAQANASGPRRVLTQKGLKARLVAVGVSTALLRVRRAQLATADHYSFNPDEGAGCEWMY